MEIKTLLTLALLTVPSMHAADRQAHPQLVGHVLAGHSINKIITHPNDPSIFAAAIPTYKELKTQPPGERVKHIFCVCCFHILENGELEKLGVCELSSWSGPYPEMVFRVRDGALLVVDKEYSSPSTVVINLWNVTENCLVATYSESGIIAFFTVGGEYLVISQREPKTITLIDTASGDKRVYDLQNTYCTEPDKTSVLPSSLRLTRHAWVLDSGQVVVSFRHTEEPLVGYVQAFNIDTKESFGGLQTSFAASYALSKHACLADFSGTPEESGTIKLLNLVTGTSSCLNHPELQFTQELSLIKYNIQGSLLIIETYISELGKSPMLVWNIATSEAACLFADTNTSLSMSCGGFAFDATNTHMLLATWDGVEIWDISSIINQLQKPEDGKREE